MKKRADNELIKMAHLKKILSIKSDGQDTIFHKNTSRAIEICNYEQDTSQLILAVRK